MAQFELNVANLQAELREMFRGLDQLDDAQQIVVGEVFVSQGISAENRLPVFERPIVSHHCTANENGAIMKHGVSIRDSGVDTTMPRTTVEITTTISPEIYEHADA